MKDSYKQQQLKILNKALSNDDYLYRQLVTIHGWANANGADNISYAYRYLDEYCPEEIDNLLKQKYLSKGND